MFTNTKRPFLSFWQAILIWIFPGRLPVPTLTARNFETHSRISVSEQRLHGRCLIEVASSIGYSREVPSEPRSPRFIIRCQHPTITHSRLLSLSFSLSSRYI